MPTQKRVAKKRAIEKNGKCITNSHTRNTFASDLFPSFIIVAYISRSLAATTLTSPFINHLFTILQTHHKQPKHLFKLYVAKNEPKIKG